MSRVGSGIINVITESLYDNPIVVFREYVQNSVDSLYKLRDASGSEIRIYYTGNSLYFADNGNGIIKDLFDAQMGGIANSSKSKSSNLGYKGIGRLSGLPHCDCLRFFNILDYSKNEFQQYSLDGKKYTKEKNTEQIQNLTVEEFLAMLSSSSINYQDINMYLNISDEVKRFF